jgi:hypothetical protein
MRKLMVVMAMALVLCGAFAMSAQAFVIDFEIQPIQTGSLVTYAGGATNLVGFDIKIDKITGIDTPLNAGNAAALTNTTDTGLWNFTAPGFTAAFPDHWLFESALGTTSLAITGTFTNAVTLGSVTDPVPFIAGSWTNAEVHQIGDTNNYAVTGVFTDLKASTLLAYFGLTDPAMSATFTFGISLPAGIVPGDAIESLAVQSGDITQVPVPPAVWLLGTGLLGLVGLRRKVKA